MLNPTSSQMCYTDAVAKFQITHMNTSPDPCTHICKIELSDGREKVVSLGHPSINCLVGAIPKEFIVCHPDINHFDVSCEKGAAEQILTTIFQDTLQVNLTPNPSLFELAYKWETSKIRNHLKQNPECVNNQNPKGLTMLSIASLNANLEMVKMLLEFHADPNIANLDGESALHLAGCCHCKKEDSFEIVTLLVNAGARLTDRTKKGDTPLHYVNLDLPTGQKIVDYLLKICPDLENIKNHDGYDYKELDQYYKDLAEQPLPLLYVLKSIFHSMFGSGL